MQAARKRQRWAIKGWMHAGAGGEDTPLGNAGALPCRTERTGVGIRGSTLAATQEIESWCWLADSGSNREDDLCGVVHKTRESHTARDTHSVCISHMRT